MSFRATSFITGAPLGLGEIERDLRLELAREKCRSNFCIGTAEGGVWE